MSLHWLKTRWRTRGEYAARLRRWLGGFGKANALVIVAILLAIFVYYFILGSPAFPTNPEQRVQQLANRLVAAVEQGDPPSASSLDDFISAGTLTIDEAMFLHGQEAVFQPFDWGSPDTAAVLRRVRTDAELVYRKGGRTDTYTVEASPDGGYEVLIGPAPQTPQAGREMRSVTVRTVGTDPASPLIVTSLLVPEFAEAHWSPDSRYIAIMARSVSDTAIGSMTTFVLVIEDDGARRLDLPPSVDPAKLLAAEDPDAQLESAGVHFDSWHGSTLRVTSTGHGWVGPPAETGSRQAGVQCRFDLEISERGLRELGRDC